jgi:hypothetical protein
MINQSNLRGKLCADYIEIYDQVTGYEQHTDNLLTNYLTNNYLREQINNKNSVQPAV